MTVTPQGFVAGLNPKAYSIAPPKQVAPSSVAKTQSTNVDVQVDLSHMKVIKIMPEEENDGGNNFSPGKSLANSQTVLNTNSELVKKITYHKTGEDIQETTDSN